MELNLTGNQKRFLDAAPRREHNGRTLLYAWTKSQVHVAAQLEAMGVLVRFRSTSPYWYLA